MDEPAALKLALPPDTYRCTWKIPNSEGGIDELAGDIHLRANKSPRGDVYGEIPEIWEPMEGGGKSADFPQEKDHPILTCDLVNGRVVTLLDAQVFAFASDRATVFARCALVGDPPSGQDELRFNRIKIQIGNISSIFGVAPTRRTSLPAVSDDVWSVEREPESSQWWEDSGASFWMAYDSSLTAADPYHFRVRFSPVVIIDLNDGATFDELLEQWLSPLQNIVSLALGKRQEVTFLAIGTRRAEPRSVGWSSKYQVFGYGLHQEPFDATLKDVIRNPAVMNWKTDAKNPLEVLRTWSALREQHNPLIETYGTLLTAQPQHPRAKVLLLLQALEGLHGFENKEKEAELSLAHRDRRLEMLNEIFSATSLSGKDKRFLKRNFTSRPLVSLDARLRESFSVIPEGVMSALASTSLMETLACDPREPKIKDPADILRLARNDLSHGNRGYPIQDLEEVAEILEKAARAHLLRCLGGSQAAQAHVIKGEDN
ncbi:ApeA N-terminal domain 1-containing protein [Streptomyces parvus]|uniref:ApeA N-terminal domain 1-containing protein n=1 Tax=Streptomyces parvus TaxID=66428 RepID=UPI003410F4F7